MQSLKYKNLKRSCLLNRGMTKFYHHHNATGMAVALSRYQAINAQQEAAGITVRYGPPAHGERVLTEDVTIHAATGIYIPRESFPEEATPVLRLEDAIAELHSARKIPTGRREESTPSAARTCR